MDTVYVSMTNFTQSDIILDSFGVVCHLEFNVQAVPLTRVLWVEFSWMPQIRRNAARSGWFCSGQV